MPYVVKSMALIDTGRLIQEVQSRPPLWNHLIVSGKETVERLWGEVADALGTTGKDAKQKWKNLKDTFRKEMKKSIECGASYAPMWPHYQRLSFLTEVLLQSKRISYTSDDVFYSNASHQHEPRFDSEDSNTENQIIGEPEVKFSPKRRRATEGIVVEPKHDPEDVNVTGEDNSAPNFSVNPRMERGAQEVRFAHRPTTSQPAPNSWDCYAMDEDYHFFMSLMPHMKAFQPLQKLKIRNRIQDIIIQEMTTEPRSDAATSSTESAK